MKKYTTHIKLIFLVLLILTLYGFAGHRNHKKEVSDIDVTFSNGNNLFITYETVNKLLIQSFNDEKNQLIESLHLNNLENSVESNDMIQNAEIYTTIDGKLGAIITQRTPVLRVIKQGANSYYFDNYGEKMPLSNNYSARVPILSEELLGEDNDELIKLANEIKADDFLQKQVIGLTKIEKKGTNQFNLKTRVGDQTIIFGTIQDFDIKTYKLKAFYQKTLKDGTLKMFDTINLKFKDQVVCTKK